MHDLPCSQPNPDTARPRAGQHPMRRRAVGHGIAGLAAAGILAVLSGCAVAFDNATSDGSGRAATSRSEGTPAPLAPSAAEEISIVSGQLIDTPCWSYEGPQTFVNNISVDEERLCAGALELWGEVREGTVVPTGVGAIYGQVSVEPVRVSTSDSWMVGTDVDGAVDAVADSYFAQNGKVISLHEAATLDGVPANITRVEGSSSATQTKAFVSAFAPAPFTPGTETVQFFVIAIVTPYDNGDELIAQVIETWQWH
ncbi:hypothetical protein EQW78_15790 [Oerskovia turbata]|uniref:Uncharacterized protein n=1 Tax=Oerskovia turbata TaxID=1713 RepID=A0A4Q1KPK6_9CELL|nr:hypothetical protein EQW78_15790 [Oerskovia turbata]